MPPGSGKVPRVALQAVRTDLSFGVDTILVRRASPVGQVSAALQPATVVSERPASPTVVVRAAQCDTSGSKASLLAELAQRHDSECPHCTTATAHTRTVFGEGDPNARLMFIGEAPGEQEDLQGRPFVGRAGQKLDEMIRAMGMTRESVYIANVLKSRPPDNRTPQPVEIALCGPYLEAQILIIRPQVIVTLGGPATKLMLRTDKGITKLRGSWAQWGASVGGGDCSIRVMPTYHPAYLLRNYTVETRREVWSDLSQVVEFLRAGTPSN